MKITLSARAERDLESIFSQSIALWGEAQARRYAEKIAARLDLLGQFPKAGRARPELGDGVRSVPVGAHIVFYTMMDDAILVLMLRDARKRPLARLSPEDDI